MHRDPLLFSLARKPMNQFVVTVNTAEPPGELHPCERRRPLEVERVRIRADRVTEPGQTPLRVRSVPVPVFGVPPPGG